MSDLFLNDSWSLYFHDPTNDNWDRSGYEKIFTLTEIDTFWMMFTKVKDVLNEGMFFLIRDHIFPKWNDDENKEGGFLSIKILKEKVKSFCEPLMLNLVNETLLKEEYYEFSGNVNGVSISPKKNFCIVKIWLKNCDLNDSNMFNLEKDYYGDIIFKTNTCHE
jgi:hypothetical protein